MEVIEIREDQKDKWNNFVKENGTLLQSWEWADFKSKFSWKPYRLAVVEDSKWILIASVLCRRLPLLRSFLYIPEGPVAPKAPAISEKHQAIKKLLQKIKEIADKENAIFLRIEPLVGEINQLTNLGFKKSFEDIQPAHRLWIDLSESEEEILSQMKHKGRYNIKLAAQKGVNIKEVNTEEMLDSFYPLYLETAKRDKFSVRPKEYFANLFEMLEKNSYDKMLVAFWKNQPLSAILVTFFGKYATYLYGATSSAHREFMSSYLIQWEAIKKAKQEGFQIYDFGAIAPSEEKHPWSGLREFKMKFGGKQIDLPGCYDLVYKPFLYNLFKVVEKLRRER